MKTLPVQSGAPGPTLARGSLLGSAVWQNHLPLTSPLLLAAGSPQQGGQ
jgi:hypothetical protein